MGNRKRVPLLPHFRVRMVSQVQISINQSKDLIGNIIGSVKKSNHKEHLFVRIPVIVIFVVSWGCNST